jgi:hypothetical protein
MLDPACSRHRTVLPCVRLSANFIGARHTDFSEDPHPERIIEIRNQPFLGRRIADDARKQPGKSVGVTEAIGELNSDLTSNLAEGGEMRSRRLDTFGAHRSGDLPPSSARKIIRDLPSLR